MISPAVAIAGNEPPGGRGLANLGRGFFSSTFEDVRNVVLVRFSHIVGGQNLSTKTRNVKHVHGVKSSPRLCSSGEGHITPVRRAVIIIYLPDPNDISVGLHDIVNGPVGKVAREIVKKEDIKPPGNRRSRDTSRTRLNRLEGLVAHHARG